MKIELLSPAGDEQSLKLAVKKGADAIYISGKEYGARKYAKNFTLEEIKKQIKYCHLYGVKLYVTVNTLIEEEDLEDVTNYIRNLHKAGVDAIIMQDIGLIKHISKLFPNLEIHASTQSHNCNQKCLDFLEKLKVKRAVLARELTENQIKNLNTKLDLEVFIHGALCISYSGECLISSKLLNRSGNKGACAGICRYKFDLYKENEKILENKYLLSTKELCLEKEIETLIKLGIKSLKIEGRMKSPSYVGYITQIYRKIIDDYYNKKETNLTEKELENIKVLYNRKLTKGYFKNEKEITNIETSNHQGTLVGVATPKNKKIKITLEKELNQNDGIKFENQKGMICNFIYNQKGLLIKSAKPKETIYIDNKINLKKKEKVSKTLDYKLTKEIENAKDKKVPVTYQITQKNNYLEINLICEKQTIKELVKTEKPITKETTKEEIKEKLEKLGNTPFISKETKIDIKEKIFIPLSTINQTRRVLVEKLINERENQKPQFKENKETLKPQKINQTHECSFLVRNETQLKTLINKNVNIYTENINLYNKYKENEKIYYKPPRSAQKTSKVDRKLITNNGEIEKNQKQICDIYMNIKNTSAINLYHNYAYKIGLSPELTPNDLQIIVSTYQKKYKTKPNLEYLIYGKLELMLTKHCIITNKKEEKCTLCQTKNYYLGLNNHKLKLLKDENHDTRIMDYQNINYLDKIEYLKSIGITNFRLDLLEETPKEIENLLKKINKTINTW